jgi:hypothetical protein
MNIAPHVPPDTRTIISGGAKGIDTLAANYAQEHGLQLIEILPDYNRFGRGAPIRRNDEIIDQAQVVLAFWDGKSKGTKYVIERCRKLGKSCTVILC